MLLNILWMNRNMQVELIICFEGGRWITEIIHVKKDERGNTISLEDLAKEKWIDEYRTKENQHNIVYIGLYHYQEDNL